MKASWPKLNNIEQNHVSKWFSSLLAVDLKVNKARL